MIWFVPDGHAIVSLQRAALAETEDEPERRDRNPEPAWTILVRRIRSVSTTTRAPIASRLLFDPTEPTSRTASVAASSARSRSGTREGAEPAAPP